MNSTINQLYIIDNHGLLHPTIAKYTLFLTLHGMFTKKDHILGHKTHPNKFKRIEIIQCLLSDHNIIKLEKTNRNITGKSQNICGS